MAVSGSTDFSLNRDEIIDQSLELVGAKEANLTPDPYEITQAARWLNLMIKSWHKHGTMLHVRTTGTIFLEKGKQSYNIGTGTYAARGTVSETTTNADLAAAATVITTDSTPVLTTGHNIGRLLDDDTIHWTTVSAYVSSSSYTIADALPSAAASGNKMYMYVNVAHRPVRLQKRVLRDTSGNDIPLDPWTQDEYMEINDKDMASQPSRYFYDPQLGDAVINPWPVIDKNGYKIIYKYTKPCDDLDASTDNVEFESDWELAIIYSLAELLMVPYAVDELTEKRIVRGANRYFKLANKFEVEDGSMYLQPDQE